METRRLIQGFGIGLVVAVGFQYLTFLCAEKYPIGPINRPIGYINCARDQVVLDAGMLDTTSLGAASITESAMFMIHFCRSNKHGHQ